MDQQKTQLRTTWCHTSFPHSQRYISIRLSRTERWGMKLRERERERKRGRFTDDNILTVPRSVFKCTQGERDREGGRERASASARECGADTKVHAVQMALHARRYDGEPAYFTTKRHVHACTPIAYTHIASTHKPACCTKHSSHTQARAARAHTSRARTPAAAAGCPRRARHLGGPRNSRSTTAR